MLEELQHQRMLDQYHQRRDQELRDAAALGEPTTAGNLVSNDSSGDSGAYSGIATSTVVRVADLSSAVDSGVITASVNPADSLSADSLSADFLRNGFLNDTLKSSLTEASSPSLSPEKLIASGNVSEVPSAEESAALKIAEQAMANMLASVDTDVSQSPDKNQSPEASRFSAVEAFGLDSTPSQFAAAERVAEFAAERRAEQESEQEDDDQEEQPSAADRFAESNTRLRQATEMLLQVSQLGGPVNIQALLDEHI